MSAARYRVIAHTSESFHETPDAAIAAARRVVHLTDKLAAELTEQLRAGNVVQYAYGFVSAWIGPTEPGQAQTADQMNNNFSEVTP